MIEVVHPKYGQGVLIEKFPASDFQEIWLISFANGELKFRVNKDELKVNSKKSLATSSKVKSKKKIQKPAVPTVPEQRFAIESLRYGLVYPQTVEQLTAGSNELVRKLEQLISRVITTAKPETYVLVGEYGTGKTHFLNYCSYIAQKHGMSSSYVETTINHNLSRPADFYSQIIKNLIPYNVHVISGPSVFVEHYCRSKPFRNRFSGILYLSDAFKLAKESKKNEGNILEPVSNFLAGESNLTKLKQNAKINELTYRGGSLFPRDVTSKINRFSGLLQDWALIAKAYHNKGKGGLVVLIDEAELFGNVARTPEDRRRASILLEKLSDLNHNCPLLIIFATTNLENSNDPLTEYVEQNNINKYILKRPDQEMAESIVENIVKTYKKAYPDLIQRFEDIDSSIYAEKIHNQDINLRSVIRSVVDRLDILSLQ